MFNTLYGWYLKNELGCVFDTITFAETLPGSTTSSFEIVDAAYGEVKKLKLGTYHFIINRIFSLSEAGSPVEVEILPDGDFLNGFVSVVYAQRVVEPTTPMLITMGMTLNATNTTGLATDMYMVFEGFWLPKSAVKKFDELVEMVVTSQAKIDNQTMGTVEVLEAMYEAEHNKPVPHSDVYTNEKKGMMGWYTRGETVAKIPYCKRRRD